jgi:branched-chain amino acid transport system permease protein
MLMQHIVNAVLLGGIYASIGVGFSLVYGVLNIINLTHGALVMLGGYATYWLFVLYGIDPFLSVPLTSALFFGIGLLLQWSVINRILHRGIFMVMIATYGIAMIFSNMAHYFWTGSYRSVKPAYAGMGFELLGAVIPYSRLGILAMALLLTTALYLFMNQSRIGMAIQAVSLNQEAARLTGVKIDRIYAIAYGISAALAGAAGSLVVSVYAISPAMEISFLAKAFVVAVLGGLGNMAGAMIGGFILSGAETAGVAIFGSTYQNLTAFTIFLIVLVFRPYGLMGRRFFAEI